MSEVSQSIIRRNIQIQRKFLSQEEIKFKSQQITNIIISKFLPQIPNILDKKIALYLSSNNEVETFELLRYFFVKLNHPNIALPFITENNIMNFKKYILGDNLIKNIKFKNLLEPEKKNLNINPQIIFVPLVACDKKGNRIGMGGGFYDRKIEQMRKNNQNPTTIGLAYNFQILPEIQPGKFDQSLDFIACETDIIECA